MSRLACLPPDLGRREGNLGLAVPVWGQAHAAEGGPTALAHTRPAKTGGGRPSKAEASRFPRPRPHADTRGRGTESRSAVDQQPSRRPDEPHPTRHAQRTRSADIGLRSFRWLRRQSPSLQAAHPQGFSNLVTTSDDSHLSLHLLRSSAPADLHATTARQPERPVS